MICVASTSAPRSAGLNAATARSAPASFTSLVGLRFSAASSSDSKRTRVALSTISARAIDGLVADDEALRGVREIAGSDGDSIRFAFRFCVAIPRPDLRLHVYQTPARGR